MNITTLDVIKILPFENGFKENLLSTYEALSEDQRYNIEQAVWDLYDALYELKLEENMDIALAEAKNNQEKLDPNFYKRVREVTRNEMASVSEEDLKKLNLQGARKKLAEIISSN